MIIKPWNKDIWFSPCFVINEWAKQARLGNKKIKKYEEAWVTAVTVIHLSKGKTKWWIQVPEKLNDTPDINIMTVIKNLDNSQDMGFIDVEIFEIRDFKEESIEASIERKLGKKDYSGMLLVGFVRRRVLFDYNHVYEYLKKIKPKAEFICLLFSETEGSNQTLIQVYPVCIKSPEINFGNFCKITTQNDFIIATRSTKVINGDTHTSDDIYTLVA